MVCLGTALSCLPSNDAHPLHVRLDSERNTLETVVTRCERVHDHDQPLDVLHGDYLFDFGDRTISGLDVTLVLDTRANACRKDKASKDYS